MIEKLKSCPFCGGNASVLTLGNEAKVECDVCTASSTIASGEHAKETAIRLWNTRSYAECELAITASFAFVAGLFDNEEIREHAKHEIITAIKSGELKAEEEAEIKYFGEYRRKTDSMCRKEIAEQDARRPTATKHTAMSGSNGYIAYTCGECGKHVGRDARYCGNCGAYFGE